MPATACSITRGSARTSMATAGRSRSGWKANPTRRPQIVIDYNVIKQVVAKYDHQIILNSDDPMVPASRSSSTCSRRPGDPTSELLARVFRDDL